MTRIVLMVLTMLISKGESQLTENYYSSSCPKVESIVTEAVTTRFNKIPTTALATLRLFFHDCIVEGCDASVIIWSENGDAEKDASDNVSLEGDGFATVIVAKQAVEAACPGVVSCADILALASRDALALLGGPAFKVELGRKDGLISKASSVEGNLPKTNFKLDQLNSLFSKHGLTQTDMIALSGAHTVGFSHCNQFANRLYSFSPSNPVDPTLDPTYAKTLMAGCPPNPDPTLMLPLDPQSPNVFDNSYYKNLVSGKGLLPSDQVLFTDSMSRPTVVRFANNTREFSEAFVQAMRKLGRVGVKTANDGEIRRDCTKFNS